MIMQKKCYGWLYATLVFLPLTAILSGCGSKVEEPKTADTVPPANQQKAAEPKAADTLSPTNQQKAVEPKAADTLPPVDQQKTTTSTQQGIATEAARKQAEAEYLARKRNSGTTP